MGAGKAESLRFVVDPKFNPIVTWDFSVADYTVDFRATFESPAGQSTEIAVPFLQTACLPAILHHFA